MTQRTDFKKIVILNNIRSLYNVGAIFRTCEAAGVNALYLCGITGHPEQSERIKRKIAKTALGNIERVKWKYYQRITFPLKKLKKDDWQIVSIEQSKNSMIYKNFELKKNTAFVFGNEVDGVEKKVLDMSDTVLELPMKGSAISLNVATTVGIILYHFL